MVQDTNWRAQRLTIICWGLAVLSLSRWLRLVVETHAAAQIAAAPAEDGGRKCASSNAELLDVWALPPRSTLILVAGLEASGTKEVGRIVAHLALACEYGTWPGYGACIDDARGNAVVHRSLPHGARGCRTFPDLDGIVDKAVRLGFDVRVVVAVRDRTIALASGLRAGHEAVAAVAALRQQRGVDILRAALQKWGGGGGGGGAVQLRLFSYEAYAMLGAAYVRHVFGDGSAFLPYFDGPGVARLEAFDANRKYVVI